MNWYNAGRVRIPNSGRIRTCAICGRRYFFYKKDKDTLKEKYCTKCIKKGAK